MCPNCRIYNTKSESQRKPCDTMCPWRFLTCMNTPLWRRMSITGEDCARVGQELYRNFLYFQLNFSVNLKLL